MSDEYTEESVEWVPLGEIQQFIKKNIRTEEREGRLPTFEEFAVFITHDLMNLTRRTNNHWKPIYFNCAPCIERFYN